METINNLANAASKAVFGETNTNQEPVSGQKGNTAAGEPYDAGNIENKDTTATSTAGNTATGNATSGNTSTTDTTANTGSTDKTNTNAPSAANTSTTNNPSDDSNPTRTKDSSVHPAADSTKSQNDTRDPSDPHTHPDDAAQKKNVDDSTGGTDKGDNPVKVDGPGPKPIDQVAREHGGDAGKSDTNVDKSGDDSGAQKQDNEDDGDGPQKTSHGEGTGEKYVKSSGLKADGGDFDAATAGAGKEADRLLEEKGVHHSGDNHGKVESPEDEAGASQEKKPGFGEKIKAKLHHNKQEH